MTTSLRLAIVRPSSPHDGDPTSSTTILAVRAEPGTTLGHVRTLMPDAGLGPEPAVDGIGLSDDAELGRFPLVDGALLEPRTRSSSPGHPLALACVEGPRQGQCAPLEPGITDIGRGHPLLGDDPLASRRHARVRLVRGEVRVEDLDSSNGLALDARPIPREASSTWRVGGHLRIGSSLLRLDTTQAPTLPTGGLPPGAAGQCDNGARLTPVMTTGELPAPRTFTYPEPPNTSRHAPLRWIAVLAPIPVAGILAYVMHSAMILCFMVLGPVVLVLTHVDDRRRGKRSGRSEIAAHRDATHRTTAEVARQLAEEQDALRLLAPDPLGLMAIASGERAGFGMRRGEHARLLRLGHGSSPSAHHIVRGSGAPRALRVDDAPVCIRIHPGTLTHLDVDPEHAETVLEIVAAQLAVLADGDAGPSCVITPRAGTPRWVWCENATLLSVSGHLPGNLVAALAANPTPTARSRLPLVAIDAEAVDAPALAEQLVAAGAGIVWVGHRPPVLPPNEPGRPARDQRVHLEAGHRASRLTSGHAFTLDSPIASWFPAVMRLQSRWATSTAGVAAQNGVLVESTPHDLLPHDIGDAWARATLAVPIGHGQNGVMTLDLSRCGPHALVAGTTGSGKSEFLLSYLRGLFTLNSPSHVNALLIDYKGGATFGALMNSPHVVGVVTDLDEGLAARALVALRAEIKRREHLLALHGVSSFRAYEQLGPDAPTLARLFVVVDEFRVLAEELPDFVAGLVRLAAVGRSLGMHLVLATQRPGGAVTADMRANLDVRIALRVRERADSLDVIEVPDAARISPRTPGRGYLATSGEPPVMFQSAYSGAARRGGEALDSTHVHPIAVTNDGCAEVTTHCLACRPATLSDGSDLDLFVTEAIAAAAAYPLPHRPVLPPLADVVRLAPSWRAQQPPATHDDAAWLDLTSLTDLSPNPRPTDPQPADGGLIGDTVVAVADLPAAQSQPWVICSPGTHVGIAGSPRSGRTHAACVFARSMRASEHSQLWWVGAPGTTQADAFFDSGSPDDIVRLLTLLAEPAPADTATVVVVDGWEELHATLLRINHGAAVDDMHRHVAEAHRARRTFVVTGARTVIASKLSTVLGVKLVLRQNDASEYSLAGLRPNQVPHHMPPGRAIVLPHGHVMQIRADDDESPHREGM